MHMPTHKQSGGYQWGESGKVYKGKSAKAKANKQGAAIRASGWHGEKTSDLFPTREGMKQRGKK
jgi:hypothetical protein